MRTMFAIAGVGLVIAVAGVVYGALTVGVLLLLAGGAGMATLGVGRLLSHRP